MKTLKAWLNKIKGYFTKKADDDGIVDVDFVIKEENKVEELLIGYINQCSEKDSQIASLREKVEELEDGKEENERLIKEVNLLKKKIKTLDKKVIQFKASEKTLKEVIGSLNIVKEAHFIGEIKESTFIDGCENDCGFIDDEIEEMLLSEV